MQKFPVSVIYKRESVKAFPKNVLHAFVLLVRKEEAPLALGKERDVIGRMASVEKEILTSAVHSSSIVGNKKKLLESLEQAIRLKQEGLKHL